MGEQRYVTLLTSLPYHGRLFGARQTPLSRFQLNKRLAWLTPEDAATLESMESLLRWSRNLLLETDAGFLDQAKAVIDNIDNPLLVDILKTRLEMRTLVAALRKRTLGHPAPASKDAWGYGRWLQIMQNHWQEPDFGLGQIYPWIIDAERLMRRGDTLGLERTFMNRAWRHLARCGAGHYFDFEAVVIYVLRWDLIDRWTRYDEEEAQKRITGLTEAGLGNYQQMYQ